MIDPRLAQLSRSIVNYSLEVKPGENVLIEVFGQHFSFAHQLIREVYSAGGRPYVWLREQSVQRELLLMCTEEQLCEMAQTDGAMMRKMNAYVGIRGGDNSFQFSDVPGDRQDLYTRLYLAEVHGNIRVPQTKWVVMRYPSPSMAQLARMSTQAFEDFYFDVCNLDYRRMSKAMDSLVARMNRTDRVRLTGKGTDLTFSIRDIPAIKCDGKLNIPDGEIFTAPVRDSLNGTITFNTPALYQGRTFENISLTFRDGRIVSCAGSDTARMEAIFDTDEGARYVGEFAIGVNPYIASPMKDTLFDEKIAGSIHLTPGKCYDEAPNGNESAIHWDLVMIQTPEYGGGDIYFDDELVRHDGLFVTEDLQCLNPENLK
ncbi:MAG: aminopeptidase [Christensenellales bacterium]|jgi:aminopeptidase